MALRVLTTLEKRLRYYYHVPSPKAYFTENKKKLV